MHFCFRDSCRQFHGPEVVAVLRSDLMVFSVGRWDFSAAAMESLREVQLGSFDESQLNYPEILRNFAVFAEMEARQTTCG